MNETLYRSLFESVLEGILILDTETGIVVDANPFLVNLLGCSRENILSRKVWELPFLKSFIANENNYRELQAKEKCRYENLSLETRDGRQLEMEFVCNHCKANQQRMIKCNIRNITEQNKGVKALIESEALFRGMFKDHSAVMLCIDNNTGQIVEANQAAAQFYGYSLEKLMQMKIQQLNTLSDEEIAEKMRNAANKHINFFEFRHLLADGSIRDVEVHSTPITVRNQKLLFSIIHDITERKKLTKALQQSEERFRSYIENASDIVYALSEEGLFTYISPNSLQYDGIPADEMIGQPIDSFLHPDDINLCHEFLKKTLTSGEKQVGLEYRVRHRDGTWRWHLSNAAPLRDENGKVAGYIGIARDITEKKQAENYREIRREILLILNEQWGLKESIRRILKSFRTRTGVDAVGMRLKEGEDFPYFAEDGFTPEFLEAENSLFQRNIDGGVCRDKEGNIRLECTCGLVLSGKTDSSSKLFTKGGSCWINDSFPLLDLPANEDPRMKPRNNCIHQGYASVALIPIRIDERIVGLIQLNDKRKGHFTIEIIGILEDIAAHIGSAIMRKRAEDSLRESEEIHRALIDGLPDIVMRFDRVGRHLFVSENISEIVEMEPAQFIGKTHAEIGFPNEQCRSWEESIKRVFDSGEPFETEFTIEKKAGPTTFNCRLVLERDADGAASSVLAISRDITEKKQAEEQIRFLGAITENMQESIMVTDTNGQITYINKAARKLFGYNLQELVGKNPNLFNIDAKADEIQRDLFETVARGETYNGEALNRRKDGSEFICQFSIAPLLNQKGGISSYIGLSRDITTNRNLEKAVIRKERLSAIGELASGVAHDFNNALQIIVGGVELALKSKEPVKVNQYLESIKNSSLDAASRVKQLQRFAQKSHSEEESTLINVNKLAKDVIIETKFLLNQYQEKGIHIAVNTDLQAKRYVDGNVGELRACLFNLLKNSAEAMPDGGNITISTNEYDGKVFIEVADTGTGMDKETQKKIFQPFFTTRGFEPGRGLGMSQVYSTIRDHNGNIYVKESQIDQGTIIEICLPFSNKQVSFEKKEEDYNNSAKILWVDDEKMIRDMGKNMLEIIGHDADFAASGAEALEFLAKGNQYDLLITDIGMREMSGWQLIEQIKNKEFQTKIAIVTGWGAEVSREMKEKYNVGYVLVKPLTIKDLQGLINKALHNVPNRQES